MSSGHAARHAHGPVCTASDLHPQDVDASTSNGGLRRMPRMLSGDLSRWKLRRAYSVETNSDLGSIHRTVLRVVC